MKSKLILLVVFFFAQYSYAQNESSYVLMRSTLGSSGSSHIVETSRGVYKISQSIGQSSVIGTHYSQGYFLRQGYQQPMHQIIVVKEIDIALEAKVYPNPFNQSITISFNSKIESLVLVEVLDVHGRVVYKREFEPMQEVELQLRDMSIGSYLLKAKSKNKRLNVKLIKY